MTALLHFARDGQVVHQRLDLNRFPTRESYLEWLEEERVKGVIRRRMYYEGRQYDESNLECMRSLAANGEGVEGEKAWVRAFRIWRGELPEHLRLHEYSTQLAGALNFIAGRLTNKAAIEAEDDAVQKVINDALDASPELAGTDDDDEITLVNVVLEALQAGDVPVRLRWDAERRSAWLEFWNSETVEMRFRDGRPDLLDKVIVTEQDWQVLPGTSEEWPVTVRRTWEVVTRTTVDGAPIGSGDLLQLPPSPDYVVDFRLECRELVEVIEGHGQSEPIVIDERWCGVPFLPWWPLRANRRNLRSVRGESLITEQAMNTSDRYNAVEQVSWLIARYNSHSNVAAWGDTATSLMSNSQRIQKDVADILLLPGADGITSLSLPTDPAMIEHQRSVLLDALFECMGVTRVDQNSLEGLGGVTGYALEILNEKSDGTFQKISKQLRRDLKKLLNLLLDCTAFWSRLDPELLVVEDAAPFDEIEPRQVYPNRKITVTFGSGYVVDEAKLRDDYVAKLVSQEYVLRKKGLGAEEIKQILREQADASAKALEVQRQAFGETGTESGRFDAGQKQSNGKTPVSTSAGKPVSTVARGAAR